MEKEEQPAEGSKMGGEIMQRFLEAGNPYDGSWEADLSRYAEADAWATWDDGTEMIVAADAPTPRTNSLARARHIVEQQGAAYLSEDAWRDPYFRAGLLRQVLIHMQAGYDDEMDELED